MSTTSDRTAYDRLLTFQTRLQGVGNSLAADISKLIAETDPAVIRTVIRLMPTDRTITVRARMKALDSMIREIERIRKEGFDLAEKTVLETTGPAVARSAGKPLERLSPDSANQAVRQETFQQTDRRDSQLPSGRWQVDFAPSIRLKPLSGSERL